jgi:hypothetical protein
MHKPPLAANVNYTEQVPADANASRPRSQPSHVDKPHRHLSHRNGAMWLRWPRGCRSR